MRRLHDALVERGRETWVDWKDIPLTANFLQEVYAGIEGSDTFAFMISSDFLDSKVCKQELDYAVDNNKRLAPIWHRKADDEAVPRELASHNWVSFAKATTSRKPSSVWWRRKRPTLSGKGAHAFPSAEAATLYHQDGADLVVELGGVVVEEGPVETDEGQQLESYTVLQGELEGEAFTGPGAR